MKNCQFNTGISEKTHSKRIIVTAITGVKEYFGMPVLNVAGGIIENQAFSGTSTIDGSVCLTGAVVDGSCLLDELVCKRTSEPTTGETKRFITLLLSLTRSAVVVKEKTGLFPPLFLNGIFFDENGSRVTYLPAKLAEFLSAYLSEEKRKAVHYVAAGAETGDERSFTRSCALLLYLLFSGVEGSQNSPVFYLADRVPGFPQDLADLVWNAMHNRPVSLKSFTDALERALREERIVAQGRVPLSRRRRFLGFSYSLRSFFSSRWKLIILLILLGGILSYILADIVGKSGKIDYAAGLAPHGVVELYYSAMNRLDLDVLESLFYRRAGREVINEISTLFVMSRLEQIYGRRFEPNAREGVARSILSIRDLSIEPISDGEQPEFHARYKKNINTEGKLAEYLIDETISLKKIKNRWYIVKSERKIVE